MKLTLPASSPVIGTHMDVMENPTHEDLREMFARNGLRCTKQREAVYRVLRACKSHPTAEELFQQVRDLEPGVSLATIYNTVDVFVERGLCRRLTTSQDGGGSACRYDADTSEHVHLVSADGEVRDLPEELAVEAMRRLSPDLIERIERAMGVRVQRVNLEFISRD